ITIALDAMGGDHAPRAEVEGAIAAARELGVRVLLVGIEATVRQELDRPKHPDLPIELVTAGNPGAAMTVARFVIGTLPSVDRPALAAAFPNMKEKTSIVLDVGANVDSKPAQIEQFAVMGDIYY